MQRHFIDRMRKLPPPHHRQTLIRQQRRMAKLTLTPSISLRQSRIATSTRRHIPTTAAPHTEEERNVLDGMWLTEAFNFRSSAFFPQSIEKLNHSIRRMTTLLDASSVLARQSVSANGKREQECNHITQRNAWWTIQRNSIYKCRWKDKFSSGSIFSS